MIADDARETLSVMRPTSSALRSVLGQIQTAKLQGHRANRYASEEQAIPLEAFPAEYGATFLDLYADLRSLATLLGGRAGDGHLASLEAVTERFMRFTVVARRLAATIRLDDRLAKAVHDVRVGALTALILELQACAGAVVDGQSTTLSTLVRDHMKIMRNVVDGLDEGARRSDLAKRPHSLRTLDRALHGFLEAARGTLRVLPTQSTGENVFVAESCVEFAALERAAFNLMNNALAYSAGEIEIVTAVSDGHLQLAVANGLTTASARDLASKLAERASLLFGDFSTSGSGRGLRIVADLVASAYGITTLEELVAKRYVGTTVVNDTFVTWIHWPVLAVAA